VSALFGLAASIPLRLSAGSFATEGQSDAGVLGTNPKPRVAAKAGTDKFSGLELDRNGEGAPLVADWAAHFECAPVHMFDGGHHVIFQRFPPRAHRDNP
jgi:flavin reductase (DIM6/NTAB) family NADH-FMN oxidoreductase RutF